MSGEHCTQGHCTTINGRDARRVHNPSSRRVGQDSPLGVKVFRTYCEEWEAAERDPARRDKIPKYEAQLQLIDELEEKVFV